MLMPAETDKILNEVMKRNKTLGMDDDYKVEYYHHQSRVNKLTRDSELNKLIKEISKIENRPASQVLKIAISDYYKKVKNNL